MLIRLTKIFLRGYIDPRDRTGKKRKLKPWAAIALTGALVCFSLFFMFRGLIGEFAAAGDRTTVFFFLGVLTAAICAMSDVMLAQNELFESKHNELLLAMPIRMTDIAGARVAAMYLFNLVLAGAVAASCFLAYFLTLGFDAGMLAIGIGCVAALPAVPLFLGGLIGLVLNRITARMKNANLIKLILYFLLVGVYWNFSMHQQDLSRWAADSQRSLSGLGILTRPFLWFSEAIGEKAVGPMFALAAVSAGLMALMIWLLGLSYRSILTVGKPSAKRVYTARPLKTHSLMRALWLREARRAWSSFTLMVNILMPIALMIAAAGAVIYYRRELAMAVAMLRFQGGTAQGANLANMVGFGLMAVLMVITASYAVSCALISLDGPSRDLLGSLPLKESALLRSKLWFHYSLLGGFLLAASVVMTVVVHPAAPAAVGMIAVPQLFLFLTDELGLWANLRFPRLAWRNEAEATKNSTAALIYVLGSMALVLLPVGLYAAFWSDAVAATTYVMIVAAGYVLLAALLYAWLEIRGPETYNRMSG